MQLMPCSTVKCLPQNKRTGAAHIAIIMSNTRPLWTQTLPFEFRIIALYQPKELYQLMFKVAAKVMKGFAQCKHQGEMGMPWCYTIVNVIFTPYPVFSNY